MRLGTAFVEVRPDTRAFKRDLEQQTTRSASDVSRTLGAALAGGAFLAGAKRATDAASQLEQAVGGTAAVFGESAESVGRWSREAAEAAGLSERAARELTAQIGGLLKGFGFAEEEAASLSIRLATLGADLAATFGGRPEEAVQALAAALRGETDPIERYGIALNQMLVNQRAVDLGLAESTTKVDQHAKAQATLSLITERSADAQGQFAREADTAAGQAAISAAKTENAAADLGDNLLPIYSKISEVVGTVADAFGALPEPVQTAVIALAGIAALAGPVKASTEALGALAAIVRSRVTSGLDRAAVGAYNLSGNLGTLGKVMAGLGFAGAVAGIVQMAREANHLSVDVDVLAARLADLDAESRASLEGFILLISRWGELDELVRRTADSNVIAAERLLEVAESAGISGDELQQLKDIVEAKRDADVQGARDQEQYAAEMDEATGAARDQIDALEDLLDATLAQFDANHALRRSVDDVETAISDLRVAYRDHGGDSEEYRDALLDAEEALLDQAEATVRVYEETAKANGQTLTAQQRTDTYVAALEGLRDSLDPNSPLRRVLQDYIDQLKSIPGAIHTEITMDRPLVGPGGVKRFAAGGDVMDGLFRVHEGELLRKSGSEVEVIAGNPTPVLAAGGGSALTGEALELLRLIAANTAGPTTSTRLRRIQTAAGVG